MFKTLTCCIIRTVTEVCNTAWNHGAGGPQNLENSEAKSLNQCGKSMRPSNFWGMRGCYGWGAFFLFFDFFGANFSPFSCELVVHMRPGRQQGSKIWMLSKSLIPRFFSKQFWSKSIFWFRKVTTKQNRIEFDFCVPTNRGTKVSKIWNGSNSQVSKFPQQKDDGMAEVEVWQFFFFIRVDQLVWTRGPTQLGCGRSKHLRGAPGATRRLGRGQTLYVRTIPKTAWGGKMAGVEGFFV